MSAIHNAQPKARKLAAKMPQDFTMDGVRSVCRLAKKGNLVALSYVWHGATELAETILEIAELKPQQLIDLARRSLYMPALVSRSKSYNRKVADIAKALNLAGDSAASAEPARRLDSLITQFVVRRFEVTEQERKEVQLFAEVFRRTRAKKKLAGRVDASEHFGDRQLLKLGPLNSESVDAWWTIVFKPHLEDDFTILQLHGTPLYRELSRCNKAQKTSRVLSGFDGDRKLYTKVSKPKDYLVKDELKRRCQDALEHLATSLDSSKPTSKNR